MSWWLQRNKSSESDAEKESDGSDVDSVHSATSLLLDLQRASGNQSVQKLLANSTSNTDEQQQKGPGGVRIHTDDDAAKSADKLGAAAYTRGRDIYFGAGKYAPQTSEGTKLLAHELTHALQNEPGEELSRGVDAGDVVGAGDPSEIEAETTARSVVQGGGNPRARATSKSNPTAIHLAPLTEAEIATKIHDAIAGAGTDATAIINLLAPLNRDAAKIKKVRDAYVASFKTTLDADVRSELSGDDLAHALFLLNAPPPATAAATAIVNKVGTEEHKAKVGDGEVSVHKEVEFKGDKTYTGGFSTGYKGGKAADSRWVQFLWSEVLATQSDGTEKHIAASGLPVAVGTMDLTTSATAPKYKVDSGSATEPFYESGFSNVRTATGTTIYDRPDEFKDVIKKQFDAGARKVVEVDHFEDFLIREYKAIYCVRIKVTWTYTSRTGVTRATDFVSGAAVTGLPAEVKKQLDKEYPKFDYIQ